MKKTSQLNLWWKSQPNNKKGLFIGLIIGIFWAIIITMGVFTCGWNFLEWRSSLSFCNNETVKILFYTPYVYIQVGILFITLFMPSYLTSFLIFVSPIAIIMLIPSVIGMLIGTILKLKK